MKFIAYIKMFKKIWNKKFY